MYIHYIVFSIMYIHYIVFSIFNIHYIVYAQIPQITHIISLSAPYLNRISSKPIMSLYNGLTLALSCSATTVIKGPKKAFR